MNWKESASDSAQDLLKDMILQHNVKIWDKREALQALQAIPYNTQSLEDFARYVIERKN